MKIKIQTENLTVKTNDVKLASLILDQLQGKEEVVKGPIYLPKVRQKKQQKLHPHTRVMWTQAEDEFLVANLDRSTKQLCRRSELSRHTHFGIRDRLWAIKKGRFDILGKKKGKYIKHLLETTYVQPDA